MPRHTEEGREGDGAAPLPVDLPSGGGGPPPPMMPSSPQVFKSETGSLQRLRQGQLVSRQFPVVHFDLSSACSDCNAEPGTRR